MSGTNSAGEFGTTCLKIGQHIHSEGAFYNWLMFSTAAQGYYVFTITFFYALVMYMRNKLKH